MTVELYVDDGEYDRVVASVVMMMMKILDDGYVWNREGRCDTVGVEWLMRDLREDYMVLFERQWNLVSGCSRRATA
jgi:hypothetical protein